MTKPKINNLLGSVRVLPIRAIANMWAAELNIAAEIVEQELRIAVLNYERHGRGEGLLEKIPPESDWPPPSTLLDREEILWFCAKQGRWPPPEFWMAKPKEGRSFVGRPSLMNARLQELTTRHKKKELALTLAEQARQLQAWVESEYPHDQTPKAKAIETGIRSDYWALKKQAP